MILTLQKNAIVNKVKKLIEFKKVEFENEYLK